MGEFSGSLDREINQNQENSNFMEKASKNQEDDASRYHLESKFKGTAKVDESDSFHVINSSTDKDSKTRNERMEEFLKMLKDNKSHIEWDGKKYIPKQMKMNRVNVGKIRNRQVFDELKMKASFINTSILLPVNIFPDDEDSSKIMEGKINI